MFMTPRRPIWKRLAACTAALMLLLTVYAASYPVNLFVATFYFPRAMPVVFAVYSPLIVYAERPKQQGVRMSLGGRLYYDYAVWAYGSLSERIRGNEKSNSRLDTKTPISFSNTSLRDVLETLGTIHDCPIELDREVDGDVEVSI